MKKYDSCENMKQLPVKIDLSLTGRQKNGHAGRKSEEYWNGREELYRSTDQWKRLYTGRSGRPGISQKVAAYINEKLPY